ncbi:hypothetical protein Q5P01_000018, partial [Channa striata]
ITVYPGDTVTLPCTAPNSTNITAVEWIRPDLEPEYVFVHQNLHFNMSQQHPSFENRVELKDSEMKDGDVSLILKNVTSCDMGRYFCDIEPDSIFYWTSVFVYVHRVPINITAEPGETVTLPCECPSITQIFAVKMVRPDLEPDVVFVYSEIYSWFMLSDDDYSNSQHISYNNRMELKDSELTDGEASLFLKNVMINDTGTYECYIQTMRGDFVLISIINLHVHSLASTAPAHPGLSVLRIIVHLVVFCPYVISTLLMVSLCGRRPTERIQPISMMTSPTSDDDNGPDTQNDYVTADVTTEHQF